MRRRRFEAINVAMGNSRPSPYSFCLDAHAGIDADIVSWEMVRGLRSDIGASAESSDEESLTRALLSVEKAFDREWMSGYRLLSFPFMRPTDHDSDNHVVIQ